MKKTFLIGFFVALIIGLIPTIARAEGIIYHVVYPGEQIHCSGLCLIEPGDYPEKIYVGEGDTLWGSPHGRVRIGEVIARSSKSEIRNITSCFLIETGEGPERGGYVEGMKLINDTIESCEYFRDDAGMRFNNKWLETSMVGNPLGAFTSVLL